MWTDPVQFMLCSSYNNFSEVQNEFHIDSNFLVGLVSSWFLPATGSLCPSANPHAQFGSPLSLSSPHGCERYSTLRSHRSTPYPSPYAHPTASPSKLHPSILSSFCKTYFPKTQTYFLK